MAVYSYVGFSPNQYAGEFVTNSGGNYVSTAPVTVLNTPLGAPDGGTDIQVGNTSDLYPKNGLLTFESGMQANSSFSTTQRVEINTSTIDYFADVLKVVGSKAAQNSILTFRMTVRVDTSGDYTFYLNANSNRFAKATFAVDSVSSQGADWEAQTAKINLVPGRDYSIVITNPTGQYNDFNPFKFEWSGPNFARKGFIPSSDVGWSYRYTPSYESSGDRVGVIIVGAHLSADKLAEANSIKYTANLTIPQTGTYQFFLSSNETSSLKLNGEAIATQTNGQENTGSRVYAAGTVLSLELSYSSFARLGRRLRLDWSGPGLVRQELQPDGLRFEAGTRKGTAYSDLGSFALTWNGATTPKFQRGASAEEVESALNALPNVANSGGKILVTKAADAQSYGVTFTGGLWYRPAMLESAASAFVKVSPLTSMALTKRDANSQVKIRKVESRVLDEIVLPNPNSFAIDNAPIFTPERIRLATDYYGVAQQLLRGSLQAPLIQGQFVLKSDAFNVSATRTGLRVISTSQSSMGDYVLKPLVDSTGGERPINFLKLGGLSFEAPSGMNAKLIAKNGSEEDLVFVSQDSSVLVTAPYEGGKLTLRLLGDANNPIFSAELRSGRVITTSRFEFVSLELGGFTIPASPSLTVGYDATADKFQFTFNGQSVESTPITGTWGPNNRGTTGELPVQQFETWGVTYAGITYEAAALPSGSFASIAAFDNYPNKVLGSLGPLDGFTYDLGANAPQGNVGIRFKTTIRVPTTGEYVLDLSSNSATNGLWYGTSQVKLNGNVVLNDNDATPWNSKVKLQLTAGQEYAVEFTRLEGRSSYSAPKGQYFLTLTSFGHFYPLGVLRPVDLTVMGDYYATVFKLNEADLRSRLEQRIDMVADLSAEQKLEAKRNFTIAIDRNRVTISKLPVLVSLYSHQGTSVAASATYSGVYANPVKMKIGAGSFSISKGVMTNIEDFVVDSFSVGQTQIDSNGQLVTTFEPLQPTTPGGYKLAYFKLNKFDRDGSVLVPANSFGIYGNKTQLPLDVAGVQLNGLADLGTSANPSLVVTNAQFNRLTYSIPSVQVGSFVFEASTVGSAKPLTVNYLPSQPSNRKSYVVLGGATMKPNATVIKSDLQVVFGGNGSDGLRIFPANAKAPASYTFGFGVASSFLAGTQAVRPVDGPSGLRLVYDPLTKAYNFLGAATIDFNPAFPHTATNLAFTGTPLEVTASLPKGVTNFPANRLDGNTLNFFLSERATLNGFAMAPRASGTPYAVLPSGASLSRGQNLYSLNSGYRLALLGNSDFVLVNASNSSTLWSAQTNVGGPNNPNSKLAQQVVMQLDGNLVVKSPSGDILWTSNTAGNPGAELRVYNNGKLVLADAAGKILWTQGTTAAVTAFDPLRVSIGATTETLGGTFAMSLEGSALYGTMSSVSFAGAKFPTSGVPLDFTPTPDQPSVFTLGGIQMDGGGKATLTDTLQLNFAKAIFDGNVIASSTDPIQAATTIVAKAGKVALANVKSAIVTKVGDMVFNQYQSTLNTMSTPMSWVFKGAATYLGKSVQVGEPTEGSPQLKIINDPIKGFVLRTLSKPADLPNASFPLPDAMKIAGLNFDLTQFVQDATAIIESASKTYSLASKDYTVKVGNTSFTMSVSMKVKVSATGAEPISFSATAKQNSQFTFGGASFQVTNILVGYNVAEKMLTMSGTAMFSFKAGRGNTNLTVSLGSESEPGLVIKNGDLEKLLVTVDGSFEILKLSAKVQKLTLEYKGQNQEFAIYGGVMISTAAQGGIQVIKDLEVSLGTREEPGIRIVAGSLQSLDITINGEINLFKITAAPKDLHIRYTAEDAQLQITGKVVVTLAPKLTLTAELPGKGLLIDTDNGTVQVRGLSLKAQGEITFGVMTIKDLHIDYEQSDSGDVTIGAGAEIDLPSGLALGGEFKIINGKLDSIRIIFERNPGILVANGLVNIYGIDVSVAGLSNLDLFEMKGTVKATVGPKVKYGAQSYALVDVQGTVTITPRDLTLEGNALFVGGKFGKGSFKGVLSWTDTPRVTFDADVKLYPGDVVQGKIKAYADINGNVDFNAAMGVFIPKGVPMAGGMSLGQLNVELRVRPALEPSASYVRFGFSDISITAIKVPTFHGNVQLSFDNLVNYGFGARFYIPLPWPLPNIDYSIDFNGSFQIRDASNGPFIDILAASSVPNTPDGLISFEATTPLPASTYIDLYADRDGFGNDGFLIASHIPFAAGTQNFTWENMAAFASPGQPVFVYAVIRDGEHPTAYSDYSSQFNTASGFIPSIVAPPKLTFAPGERVVLSQANGKAVVVNDPRLPGDPDSELEVQLDVGFGTIDLPGVPSNVRYTGAGTKRMVLRGTAADLNSALDGLYYIPILDSTESDKIDVTVRLLPLENLSGGVKSRIEIVPQLVSLELAPSQSSEDPRIITIGNEDETPLIDLQFGELQSSFVHSATVTIRDYEPGKDWLTLPIDESYETGIDSYFDEATGVLTLSGMDWSEDYLEALQSLTFVTHSSSTSKTLVVQLADDEGEMAQLTVPLQVRAGHVAPTIDVGAMGVDYVHGGGPVSISPEGIIQVATGSKIQRIEIAFAADGYVSGVDQLSYAGGGIQAHFDVATGTLLMTGEAPTNEWNAALQQVMYQSGGATFSEGNRFLIITVYDDGSENNSASDLLAISRTSTTPVHSSPVLELGTLPSQFGANEELMVLAPALTLSTDTAMLVGATISISANYIQGEDELIIGSVWDGMMADFDAKTGMLKIEGVASAYAYQDALRSVAFVDRAGFRTPGQIEFTIRVSDGLSMDAQESMLVDIQSAAFLDSPLSGAIIYELGRTSESIVPELRVQSSGPITSAVITFTDGFYPDQDELTYTTVHGIQGQFNATTGTLLLTGEGTAEHYQAALRSIQYRNTRYNPSAGDRSLSVQVMETSALSNVFETSVSVEPEVVAPNISVGSGVSFTEDGSPVQVAKEFDLTALDATTPFLAAGDELFGAEISIVNYFDSEDALVFGGAANPDILGGFDPDEGRIYLTGKAAFADYEQAIRSIYYLNTSEAPNTAPRQISIRLLDSGANGLENQLILTQVVVGIPDPIQLVAGKADDLHVLANEEPIPLGLEDLVFTTDDLVNTDAILQFVITQVPEESIGRVRMSDGSFVEVGRAYRLEELQGMVFEPEITGVGTAELRYEVFVTDEDSGLRDQAIYSDSIAIEVEGISTSTPSQAFVAQMGRDLLDEDLDAANVAALSNLLDTRLQRVGLSENGYIAEFEARQSVVREFLSSTIYQKNRLVAFYQESLHRDPTDTEIAAHLESIAQGTPLNEIQWNLVAGDEFYQLHQFNGYESYVDAACQVILGHSPSLAEKTQWVKELKQGASRTSVVAEIGDWNRWSDADRYASVHALLRRDWQPNDLLEFNFRNRVDLWISILGSDEYFAQFAVPTTVTKTLTHVTTEYPSVGKLGDINGDKAGGTLIAPQYVLVAAHSVAGIPPGQLTFTVGGQIHRVTSVTIHRNFDSDLLGTEDGNDLAILKLDQGVVGVTPSVLSGRSPRLGEIYSLVGYGREDDAPFGTKRVGSTPSVTAVGSNLFQWTRRSLAQNNSDPGDSGSPILMTINGADQVIGLVSGGLMSDSEVGDVATNTRVDAYLDWIRSIVPSVQIADVADAPSLQLERNSVYLNENEGRQSISFQVASDGEVEMDVVADVVGLLSDLDIEFGADSGGSIYYQTTSNQTGVVRITVSATSGGMQTRETLTVTVVGRNDPPTMDPVPPIVLASTSNFVGIPLTGITAGSGENGTVQLSIVGMEPARFFQSTQLDYLQGDSSGLLNVVPARGSVMEGTLDLELRDSGPDGKFGTIDDGVHVETLTIVLNNAPTVRVNERIRLVLSAGTKSVELVGISDGDQNTQAIIVSAESSNISVLDHPEVLYTPQTSYTRGSLRLTPLSVGQASITLRLVDLGWDSTPSRDDVSKTITIDVEVASQAAPWQNPDNSLDVTGDDLVTPLDALTIINKMNLDGIGPLGSRTSIEPPFYDVDGDGILRPVDALLVINSLFGNGNGGEGEWVPQSDWTDPQESNEVDVAITDEIWSDLDWVYAPEKDRTKSRRRS